MSFSEISLKEVFDISNMRKRNVKNTINDIVFSSDSDDDKSCKLSSDDDSSQETEIYEYDEYDEDDEDDDTTNALDAYRFYFNYVKVKSIASFLASITLMLLSGFTMSYECIKGIYQHIKGASKEFQKTSGSIYSTLKIVVIFTFYAFVYGLAGIGIIFIVLCILYKYGYVSFSPMNYLVEA